jgi:hypothetical protein
MGRVDLAWCVPWSAALLYCCFSTFASRQGRASTELLPSPPTYPFPLLPRLIPACHCFAHHPPPYSCKRHALRSFHCLETSMQRQWLLHVPTVPWTSPYRSCVRQEQQRQQLPRPRRQQLLLPQHALPAKQQKKLQPLLPMVKEARVRRAQQQRRRRQNQRQAASKSSSRHQLAQQQQQQQLQRLGSCHCSVVPVGVAQQVLPLVRQRQVAA